jgi:hypothetical protein
MHRQLCRSDDHERPRRNDLHHLTEILTINPSLLPTCSFCLHGDPTDSPSTSSSVAARTPVASRPKVLFIAIKAYLVVPARQFKPWRVLLDRDGNVLDGARFLYLRDAIGARLLSDDVRAAALALGLPFPATGIVSQICHDSKHDRFLIRVVWIGP